VACVDRRGGGSSSGRVVAVVCTSSSWDKKNTYLIMLVKPSVKEVVGTCRSGMHARWPVGEMCWGAGIVARGSGGHHL
jgi:hypothetical protein